MPTLSELKTFDDTDHEYDQAHAELSRIEQARPCTCQIKAHARQGGVGYPSILGVGDMDPDCELHFPWVLEDDTERQNAMRWWMAGYQTGYDTAFPTGEAANRAQTIATVLTALNVSEEDWLEYFTP